MDLEQIAIMATAAVAFAKFNTDILKLSGAYGKQRWVLPAAAIIFGTLNVCLVGLATEQVSLGTWMMWISRFLLAGQLAGMQAVGITSLQRSASERRG